MLNMHYKRSGMRCVYCTSFCKRLLDSLIDGCEIVGWCQRYINPHDCGFLSLWFALIYFCNRHASMIYSLSSQVGRRRFSDGTTLEKMWSATMWRKSRGGNVKKVHRRCHYTPMGQCLKTPLHFRKFTHSFRCLLLIMSQLRQVQVVVRASVNNCSVESVWMNC